MLPILVQAYLAQGLVHTPPDLLRGHPQIFRGKCHILLHHIGHNLVVRILEHHANGAANGNQVALVLGIHSEDRNGPPLRERNGIAVFGQGGFSAPIPAQHRHKGPLLNLQVQIPKHRNPGAAFRPRVCISQVFSLDCLCHSPSCRPEWAGLIFKISEAFTCQAPNGPPHRRAA
ncbi:unknown [Firmicutes bacterium CAG:137]|nr:unknown [Firmicutes bacterium CAG:137]